MDFTVPSEMPEVPGDLLVEAAAAHQVEYAELLAGERVQPALGRQLGGFARLATTGQWPRPAITASRAATIAAAGSQAALGRERAALARLLHGAAVGVLDQRYDPPAGASSRAVERVERAGARDRPFPAPQAARREIARTFANIASPSSGTGARPRRSGSDRRARRWCRSWDCLRFPAVDCLRDSTCAARYEMRKMNSELAKLSQFRHSAWAERGRRRGGPYVAQGVRRVRRCGACARARGLTQTAFAHVSAFPSPISTRSRTTSAR